MLVWNKVDRLSPEEAHALVRDRGGVALSAARREGFEGLLHKCEATLFADGQGDKARELSS